MHTCDRNADFNVEHHLAIGAIGVRRRVFPAIDGYCDDGRAYSQANAI
jgi:hypothetical protein